MAELEQKRYQKMAIEADRINHASKLAVQDLVEEGRYLEGGAHNLMLVLMKKVQWIPYKYYEIKWKDLKVDDVRYLDEEKPLPKHVKEAAFEDPDWFHGVITTIVKGPSDVPKQDFNNYVHSFSRIIPREELVTFVQEEFIPRIEECKRKEIIQHIHDLEERVDILCDDRKSAQEHYRAAGDIIVLWHSEYIVTGPIAQTVWTGQQCDANIREILTDWDIKILAGMPKNTTWKKGTVGTMNIIQTPVFKFKYSHTHYKRNLFPFGLKAGGFFKFAHVKRRTHRRNPQIERVARVIKNDWGIQNVHRSLQANYRREFYKMDTFLERIGTHYFLTFEIGPALVPMTDSWQQRMMKLPGMLDWCNDRGLVYLCGHNERFKLEENYVAQRQFDEMKKQMQQQQQELEKTKASLRSYKKAMRDLQKKYEKLKAEREDTSDDDSDGDSEIVSDGELEDAHINGA